MSRDKKKEASVNKKAPSDYQSGKGKTAKTEIDPFAKKPVKMVNNDQKNQAKVFLYELNNTRHEYGFSANEEWTLDLATDSQRKVLEHKYYPMLSLTVAPENLMNMLDLLEDKLGNAVGHIKASLSHKKISKESTHLLAYCAARLKY